MNILFVCHRLPYPPNRGGKIRPFNMIRHLSQRNSVVVASLAHNPDELKAGEPLKQYAEVIADVLPDSQRWMQSFAALPTSMPSSVAYFRSARLQKAINERARGTRFDVIFVHCAFVAQYVLDIPARLRVMDFGDLDSGKWAEYSQQKSFPLSWMYGYESAKLRAYEARLAQAFDRCTVTTQGEKDEFEKLGVSRPCDVIPNGVDLSYFSDQGNNPAAKPAIVFLGRMDYFPNIDAVCYFAEAILPLIRAKVPEAEFRIVGSNPARKIRDLAKLPNTVVTGHVPDVRQYVRDASMTVAPLRIARGTQNKILESIGMGIPVVASPQAAKGIQAVPGRDLLVGETPDAFAEHVIALLRNPLLRQRLALAGRKQVESAHLWPVSMNILDSVLSDSASIART